MLHVTGQAAPVVGYGLMGNFDLGVFFGVTAKAELVAGPGQQDRIFGGMGFMTDNTIAFLKRLMFNIASSLQIFGLVTLETKPAALERNAKWLLGCRIIVALFTIDPVDKRMGAVFHQFRLHR
jgi:hypothetical protein